MTPDRCTLGIDVGSTNVKLCCLDAGGARAVIAAHEGVVDRALALLLKELGLVNGQSGRVRALVTGTEGRHRLALPEVIAPVAIEAGLAALGLAPRAVVSVGGEDLVVYTLDREGRVVGTYAGNKCASGTGEFFCQQLGRIGLDLTSYDAEAAGAEVFPISARCSVFMKSDCTHLLNKGAATKGDIARSLSRLMADKISGFLTKARIHDGQVVLTGGVTKNRFLVQFAREAWPAVDFLVPPEAPYFEAFGAAHLAKRSGAALPPLEQLATSGAGISYARLPRLGDAAARVRYVPSMRAAYDPAAEYVLGIDGGSTTTKVALIDRRTLAIVAAHYGRTLGDPVRALKECLRELQRQLPSGERPRVTLCATTGSSRELLGVCAQTAGVYNEIIAHTVGTTYFEPEVDTIFEIGGQDAKYVLINNGVPIDYAMNEACSAGTGSFLEESAKGDLSVERADAIGPLALEAAAPLKFGEHCSAFINSDIRKAIQQGAARADIVAGLVYSIVSNYLNRVVGNRTTGGHVVLQGGVAKNPAVPLAFATFTGKAIVVPPDPELMGCFGVARLAIKKHEEGLLAAGDFDLEAIRAREIVTQSAFTCRACDNRCEIKNLAADGRRYPFGGRCSKYTNVRRQRVPSKDAVDWTEERRRMLFDVHAPDPKTLVARSALVVGVPRALSVHSLWPFYAHFFHELGVRAVLSEQVAPEGLAKQESSYCFPVEIAHGAVQELLDRGVDFLFLPHFRDMPSMEAGKVHACLCPLTQGLPFYMRRAFALREAQILRPLVSFKHGWEMSRPHFAAVAEQLGLTAADGERAYDAALARYHAFVAAYRKLGEELVAEIEAHPERVYVALLGRPYNAFTRDANMGIPRKLASQGVSVVPFDLLYEPDAAILPNMYWFYGQQDMKAVRRVKDLPNVYLTWISNFSCAPDSFMLHYVRWMMGRKPYLVLEIDSHSADAGLDTRVEAFLDIVESYRRADVQGGDGLAPRRYRVERKAEFCDVVDQRTGRRYDIRDPRVLFVWPPMGEQSTAAMAAASRAAGMRSVHLPAPDVRSTQLARNVASGKECIPALLVLGAILRFLEGHPPNQPDEILLFFIPSTLGPCRTGHYHVFYDRLFEELGFENVALLVGDSESSYRELGPAFNKEMWRGLVLGDYFGDALTGIQLLAQDPEAGRRVFDDAWARVISAFYRGPRAVEEAVRRAAGALAELPKRRALAELPKVLIVGEIYVRRDDFSVREIREHLLRRGIFPKVTGITEWIHYTDYSQQVLLRARRGREGLLRFVRRGGLGEEAWLRVEDLWKAWTEHKLGGILKRTGLVPEVPHDMRAVIEQGRELFIDPELESEATVSPAVGKAAMEEGYAGVVIIAPFGCLPGRLIEGVYAPWAKQQGYPVIVLENDGQPYPPAVVSRIELFAHSVARFARERAGTHASRDGTGTERAAAERAPRERLPKD